MTWRVDEGDCVELMAAMPAGSVDAVVCDPPYGIRFMGAAWDGADITAATKSRASLADREWVDGDGTARRGTRGYAGSAAQAGQYDLSLSANQSYQRWCEEWARECLRVLKPGGHLLASCGTRTYHRMTSGIEDAGFEIRDTICWLYGSGFPKSLDVSKAIDRAAGAEREVTGASPNGRESRSAIYGDGEGFGVGDLTAPATPEAERWEGWGTALKPAHEPVVVARKPLSGTVATTVLEHGTGALNVDGCRVDFRGEGDRWVPEHHRQSDAGDGYHGINQGVEAEPGAGRWPANVVLGHNERCASSEREPDDRPPEHAQAGGIESAYTSGPLAGCTPDCPVRLLDEQTGETTSGAMRCEVDGYDGDSMFFAGRSGPSNQHGDSGGASRFFYVAKASRGERNAGLEGFEERDRRAYGDGVLNETVTKRIHDVPADIGAWLRSCREAAGLTVKQVAARFPSRTGGLTGCVWNWETGANVPTPDEWRTLKATIGFDATHDEVMLTTHEVPADEVSQKFDSRAVRNGHPTVKPISLMRWLVRLVTPPGGTICDPFCGSGSTGCAAVLEGFNFVGLEREEEYVAIAEARIAWWHKHRGDGEAADILAAGEAREEVEATGQLDMFG